MTSEPTPKEIELEAKIKWLTEANKALMALLKNREVDNKELQKSSQIRMEKQVYPYLKK